MRNRDMLGKADGDIFTHFYFWVPCLLYICSLSGAVETEWSQSCPVDGHMQRFYLQ